MSEGLTDEQLARYERLYGAAHTEKVWIHEAMMKQDAEALYHEVQRLRATMWDLLAISSNIVAQADGAYRRAEQLYAMLKRLVRPVPDAISPQEATTMSEGLTDEALAAIDRDIENANHIKKLPIDEEWDEAMTDAIYRVADHAPKLRAEVTRLRALVVSQTETIEALRDQHGLDLHQLTAARQAVQRLEQENAMLRQGMREVTTFASPNYAPPDLARIAREGRTHDPRQEATR